MLSMRFVGYKSEIMMTWSAAGEARSGQRWQSTLSSAASKRYSSNLQAPIWGGVFRPQTGSSQRTRGCRAENRSQDCRSQVGSGFQERKNHIGPCFRYLDVQISVDQKTDLAAMTATAATAVANVSEIADISDYGILTGKSLHRRAVNVLAPSKGPRAWTIGMEARGRAIAGLDQAG
ncbi:hypothetical protein XH90_09500 [Bradyrhizobium sp. CCBAU 53338]|nr:hypothetical protein XH90_09500 [Bradyrhizobium sp. CCBAU 53338]